VIPVAMVGTEKLLPPGAKVPHPGPIEIRIGKPLPFDEFKDGPRGAKQRREVTDQIIAAIGELSGQEYAPIYASVRKEQLAAEKLAASAPPADQNAGSEGAEQAS
jgi:1-acyl-sn-glycerol-3-phosphate acyltransferase